MKKKILFMPLLAAMASCFPMAVDDTDDAVNADGGNVHVSAGISVTQQTMTQQSVTRAAVSEYAQALSIFIYDESGSKVAGASRRVYDEVFGQLNARLGEGSYTAVGVAHNASSGNATSTTLSKVSVPDNRVTDTFHGACVFDVMGDEPQHINLTLERCVAMLRVLSSNTPPEGTKQIKMYYTGGSSTLDGESGYGAVNSRQTEVFGWDGVADSNGGVCCEVYTFPHASEDVLKLTLSCLDAQGDVLCERVFTELPVRVGYITTIRGDLFAETGNTEVDVKVTIGSTEWGYIDVDY